MVRRSFVFTPVGLWTIRFRLLSSIGLNGQPVHLREPEPSATQGDVELERLTISCALVFGQSKRVHAKKDTELSPKRV
jgi:hypothetical protein